MCQCHVNGGVAAGCGVVQVTGAVQGTNVSVPGADICRTEQVPSEPVTDEVKKKDKRGQILGVNPPICPVCSRNPIERKSNQPDQNKHMLRKRNGRGKLKYIERASGTEKEKVKEERDPSSLERRKKIIAKRRKMPMKEKEKQNEEFNCKEN